MDADEHSQLTPDLPALVEVPDLPGAAASATERAAPPASGKHGADRRAITPLSRTGEGPTRWAL